MTKEELEKLKGQKLGGDVVGLAENRQADEALYGPEGRVVGGNSPAALGGHRTAVLRQDGASIAREPDVITPDAAAVPAQEQRKVPGGMTSSGLSIRFAPSVSDATRREVMQPMGPTNQEERNRVTLAHNQFVDREIQKNGELASPGQVNMAGWGPKEKLEWHKANLSANNSREIAEMNNRNQLENTILGGQNQLATTTLGGKNQLANTALANSGRLVEQSQQNEFTGKQNDLTRAQTAEQKALDREHDISTQRGDIAGKSFLAGLGGNSVQQIQSSPSGAINFAGLKIPAKETPDKWAQIHSEDDSGVRTTVGAFNQQTGERRMYPTQSAQRIGGNTVRPDLTEEERALLALRRARPDAYEKLREAMGR